MMTLNILSSLMLCLSLVSAQFVDQSGITIPVEPLALTCIIPGLREIFCAGKRVRLQLPTESRPRNRIGVGVSDGFRLGKTPSFAVGQQHSTEFGFLRPANVPFVSNQPRLGSELDAGLGRDGLTFGQTDNVFGVAQRQRRGHVGVTNEGTYLVSGKDNVGLLGEFLGVHDDTKLEFDSKTYSTTATRSKGLRGLVEEHESSVLDPYNFNFNVRRKMCILRAICFDNTDPNFGVIPGTLDVNPDA